MELCGRWKWKTLEAVTYKRTEQHHLSWKFWFFLHGYRYASHLEFCYGKSKAFDLVEQAKFKAATDPVSLKTLRSRGRWRKTDSLKVFYGDHNDRGLFYSQFLLLKNVITGLLLYSDLGVIWPLLKVKIRLLFPYVTRSGYKISQCTLAASHCCNALCWGRRILSSHS